MRSLSRSFTLLLVCLAAVGLALAFSGVARAGTAPTVLSVGVPTAGTYIKGQNLDFTVGFDQAVTVNTVGGTPSLPVTIGSTVVQALYITGTGTSTLTFRRVVASSDEDTDGIQVGAALNLNGGTIVAQSDGVTNADTTVNGAGSTSGVFVDGTPPSVISSVTANPNPTNQAVVNFTVTFSEGVTGVDASDFALTVTGTASGVVSSVTPVTASVYTVTVNTVAGNGTLRLDLKTTSTGITDIAGNPISGGYASGQIYTVDTSAPTISSVTVPANGNYMAGQALIFTVNYSENVTVGTGSGKPQLPLRIGTSAVNAVYMSGSGTGSLVFSYTVKSGDSDSDGISVGSAINNNGGTIADASGNAASSTLNGVGATDSVLVNTTAPIVTSVAVPSVGTYNAGQTLYFVVNFSANVTVSGIPELALTVGTKTKNAIYLSGSGTTALTFGYTPVSGDEDTDGIAVGALSLNAGTIDDSAGNPANLALNMVGSTTQVLVETTGPTVLSVSVPKAGSYTTKGALSFSVQFSAPVTVKTTGGIPSLSVTIGISDKNAVYVSGSGTDTLVFTYTVVTGDNAPSGLNVNAIALNGGTIKDSGGNDANLTLNSIGATTGVLVDTTPPAVSSIAIPANGVYLSQQPLTFTVTFSEPVTVTGLPRLTLTVGKNTAYATYTSGTGTTKLVFTYTVGSSDSDSDGIQLASALDLNGGKIADLAGNVATALTLTPPALTQVLVGTQPATPSGTPSSKPSSKPSGKTGGRSGGSSGSSDKTAPTRPAVVKASVRNGHLWVDFSRGKDNVGVAGYRIYVSGKAIRTIKGTSFLLQTSSIMPAKARKLVIDVVAVDAAGNSSKPFVIALTRSAAPKGMPRHIPGWAVKLARWQTLAAHRRGARPHTPRRMPAWYYRWAAWQTKALKVKVITA